MGIYFIAAGSSSKNRQKSLDKGLDIKQLQAYVTEDVQEKLYRFFGKNQPIYAWGANERSLSQLNKVQLGDPVVDVKNKKVLNIFEFCFYFRTQNTGLQEYIGWDSEKPIEKRRPYRYVFFLRNPRNSIYKNKNYFADAFDQLQNQNWLVGQRYFSDEETNKALNRKNANSINKLLGLSSSSKVAEENQSIPRPSFVQKTEESSVKQVIIQEDQTGVSYEKLFSSYLKGVNKVTLVDPYIYYVYQFKYFMEFAQVLLENKTQLNVIEFELVTRNHKSTIDDFEERFRELATSLKSMNIHFSFKYDDHIHDRHIKLDNEWKIILGRGLDIFKKANSRYSIAELNQNSRKCKACEITFIKIS